ncbi:MAG: ABC transporter [Puniceicoccaceae bacterium 5H]|nr:MAG: ABC transporter [Puniceicoccaceae bacterium 5H]
MVRWLWSQRRRFRSGMLLAFCRILTIAPLPLIFQHIIDKLMPEENIARILELSALTVVLLILHHILSIQGAARIGKAVAQLILDLRGQIFQKIQYLSFGYLDQQKTGRLLSKYAFDTQKIETVLMPILNFFLPNVFYSIATLAILVFLNWKLAMVVVLLLPIFALMRNRYFENFRQRNEASRVANENMAGTASEFFTALRLVRFYGEERQAESMLQVSNDEVARRRVELVRVSSSFASFSYGAIKMLSLVVVAGGAIMAIHGQVSTGTVLAFVAGLPSLVDPIQMFANISDQFFLGQEAYKSARELLMAPYVEQWKGCERPEPLKGEVLFDRVTFRYPDADRDALDAFSLHIRPGEKVALVGASGAGKSTVANLMLGLYQPAEGEIRVDGIPQEHLDMRWLRQRAAIVLQESIILSGTIADNLRFANPRASDAELRDAARLARADAFIEQLPQGYDTVVGERGAQLSGGQRQRLSIARALLRNPVLLILDEPTSALDYESERQIQAALETLAEGRTVVTIAHRLSTIRDADRILILEQGRLIDQGSYDELVERDGPFQRLLASAQGA